MPPTFQIRPALPSDAALLSEIAFAAKSFWGYQSEWMQAWRPSLTIDAEEIERSPCYAAVVDGAIVGFYLVKIKPPSRARLDHLWVLPKWIGQGIGRELFLHAVAHSRRQGILQMEIESDPQAEGFYLRMGGIRVGVAQSTVLGQSRELPVLVFDIAQRNEAVNPTEEKTFSRS